MATVVAPFSEEQARALINLRQRYEVWMEAEQTLTALPYNLKRKQIGAYTYLYETVDRNGNGKSLGAWSDEAQAKFDGYHAAKSDAQARRDAWREQLDEMSRLARALRLPALPNEAGELLREADRRRLLGTHLLVVGTNAIPAYNIEAGGFIRDVPDETYDFDLAWSSTETDIDEAVVWNMLKAVDSTYTVNMERPFQARNRKAYEVEILAAPSRATTMAKGDRPRPVPLPEQEWLLQGRPVDQVVVCNDGSPTRIVAPDPRWYALQKMWMSEQTKRNPLKRPKDAKQAKALLDAIALTMPQYPLDEGFAAALPAELSPYYERWSQDRPTPATGLWR